MDLRPTASSSWSGQQDVSGAQTDFGLRTFKDAFMTLLRIAAALLLFIGATLQADAAPPAVPADRWMEVDLYWFDPADVERSADTFWTRYARLYRGVSGYKGVVLNLGFTANYIVGSAKSVSRPRPCQTLI